ncbi:collagen alpha-1(I) chain-like [Meles meles]|uniref:collagen alpha-1(I) chain-like n=1 Tax=Meles meles TaxID=9662 RepID=UPI001E69E72C|nr:collagen alpha-1(I) chain-like [Meles meles]
MLRPACPGPAAPRSRSARRRRRLRREGSCAQPARPAPSTPRRAASGEQRRTPGFRRTNPAAARQPRLAPHSPGDGGRRREGGQVSPGGATTTASPSPHRPRLFFPAGRRAGAAGERSASPATAASTPPEEGHARARLPVRGQPAERPKPRRGTARRVGGPHRPAPLPPAAPGPPRPRAGPERVPAAESALGTLPLARAKEKEKFARPRPGARAPDGESLSLAASRRVPPQRGLASSMPGAAAAAPAPAPAAASLARVTTRPPGSRRRPSAAQPAPGAHTHSRWLARTHTRTHAPEGSAAAAAAAAARAGSGGRRGARGRGAGPPGGAPANNVGEQPPARERSFNPGKEEKLKGSGPGRGASGRESGREPGSPRKGGRDKEKASRAPGESPERGLGPASTPTQGGGGGPTRDCQPRPGPAPPGQPRSLSAEPRLALRTTALSGSVSSFDGKVPLGVQKGPEPDLEPDLQPLEEDARVSPNSMKIKFPELHPGESQASPAHPETPQPGWGALSVRGPPGQGCGHSARKIPLGQRAQGAASERPWLSEPEDRLCPTLAATSGASGWSWGRGEGRSAERPGGVARGAGAAGPREGLAGGPARPAGVTRSDRGASGLRGPGGREGAGRGSRLRPARGSPGPRAERAKCCGRRAEGSARAPRAGAGPGGGAGPRRPPRRPRPGAAPLRLPSEAFPKLGRRPPTAALAAAPRARGRPTPPSPPPPGPDSRGPNGTYLPWRRAGEGGELSAAPAGVRGARRSARL